MRHALRALFLLTAIFAISSCVTQKINTGTLTLGMTKEQAISALHMKTDGIIAARQSPKGDVNFEILQFSQYNFNQALIDRFWLTFVNDKLKDWRRAMPDQRADMTIDMNVSKP